MVPPEAVSTAMCRLIFFISDSMKTPLPGNPTLAFLGTSIERRITPNIFGSSIGTPTEAGSRNGFRPRHATTRNYREPAGGSMAATVAGDK